MCVCVFVASLPVVVLLFSMLVVQYCELVAVYPNHCMSVCVTQLTVVVLLFSMLVVQH